MSVLAHNLIKKVISVAVKFSEEEVHQYLVTKGGLEHLVDDAPELERQVHPTEPLDTPDDEDAISFELWRIIKARVLTKLLTMHRTIRYGEFIGSKIKLPVDNTTQWNSIFLGSMRMASSYWS
ncbi:hypothetical protein ACVIGA_005150 [Bradyrhizobium sp. USDA 3240]